MSVLTVITFEAPFSQIVLNSQIVLKQRSLSCLRIIPIIFLFIAVEHFDTLSEV